MQIILHLLIQERAQISSVLGDFNASSAINVTSTNKYLNVGGASLTANGTGTAMI